jgi:2-polyprenyl-3-methyl-5-hydroxy-6-metoxy-1,4-benzoquinol methylase
MKEAGMASIAGFEDLDVFNPPQTYTSAARGYDAASPGWGRVIERTLELLEIEPGDTVLDVGCGPGILSVRAAPLVGAEGSVTGIDVAEGMLDVAREKAASQGAGDAVSFELGDMHALQFPDGRFDAVACSFAMFFAQDVTAVGRELWRVLAPGGRLVVATIGEQFFEPMWSEFRRETARHRPDLDIGMPWERRQVADGGTLCGLLAAGDVRIRRLEVEDVRVPLLGPDDWWAIAEGTGIRRAIEEMGPETAQAVREANALWMQEQGVTSVTISANYVLAERPAAS